MTANDRCPECGGGLKAAANLCARCLLATALRHPTAESPTGVLSSGDSIGRYRIVRRLGEGGMGVVYLAAQHEPIAREVALKVIKLGMDTLAVLARFETEQQSLALMDHPNIARVYDAGSNGDGRPYFVMEYVSGVPITEYCDSRRLDTHRRLALFLRVADAVQHAHQKGVIHRDLKPSNILVTERDGEPVPKIIDFGLAKAIDKDRTEATLFADAGVLVGTPEYMSPEQASGGPQDLDTRTDIYALGVLLYELLVGAVPFDSATLREAGFDGIRRVIREVDPPAPATRLMSLGSQAAEVASRRGTDCGRLRKELRGDLEWITMKAMEKERARRYASASEMAADLQRHLHDEAVLASPAGAAYRVRRFIRRNRLRVGAAAVVVFALALGLAVSSWFLIQLKRQQVLTERQSYVSNLAAAQSDVEHGRIEEAGKALDRCPPGLRGWEWRYLNARLDAGIRTLWGRGESTGAATFGFSQDGNRIFWSSGEVLNVWTAASHVRSGVYGGFGEILAVSPDADRILVRSYGDPMALRVVDPVSGEFLATLPPITAGAQCAAFDRAGKRVIAGLNDGSLFSWDSESGQSRVRSGAHGKAVRVAAFNDDGKRVISGSDDGRIRIWDADLRTVFALDDASRGIVSASYASNGRVAVASRDQTIRVWNADSTAPFLTIAAEAEITRLSLDAEGRVLAYAGRDGMVRVVEVTSARKMAMLVGSLGGLGPEIRSVAFHGSDLYSASEWGDIRVWDAFTWSGGIWKRAAGEVQSIEMNASGTRILAVLSTGLEIWDARTGAVLAASPPKAGSPLRFSRDGSRAAWGDFGDVKIWNGVTTTSFKGHRDLVTSADFSPYGASIASGSWDHTVRVWSRDGVCTRVLESPERVWWVRFSPDGSRLLVTGENSFRIWNTASWQLSATLKLPPGVNSRRDGVPWFSPNGKLIFCGYQDKKDRTAVWDSRTGQLLATFRHDGNARTLMGFSPDGTRLLARSSDKRLYIWDAQNYEPLLSLPSEDPVEWAAFTPDGSRIVAALKGGTIRIFDGQRGSRAEAIRLLDKEDPNLNSSEEVLRYARRPGLEPRISQAIMAVLDVFGDFDERLDPAWKSVESDRSGEPRYRETLAWAERMAASEPSNGELLTILGAAQYRAGQFERAIATLRRCRNTRKWDRARNTAFLGMAYYRAGRIPEARQELEELRRLAAAPDSSSNEEIRDLLRQATAVIASGR